MTTNRQRTRYGYERLAKGQGYRPAGESVNVGLAQKCFHHTDGLRQFDLAETRHGREIWRSMFVSPRTREEERIAVSVLLSSSWQIRYLLLIRSRSVLGKFLDLQKTLCACLTATQPTNPPAREDRGHIRI